MDNQLKNGDEVVVRSNENFTLMKGIFIGLTSEGKQVVDVGGHLEVLENPLNAIRKDHAKTDGLIQIRAIFSRTGLTKEEVLEAIDNIDR